jgi:REase_MTES_1575
MVVEYEGRKLAVECNGEKWHSSDEKIAEDFARQAVLERPGWRFHRIRGSLFFRNQEKAMELLWRQLDRLNIRPIVEDTPPSPTNDVHESLLRAASVIRREIFELTP